MQWVLPLALGGAPPTVLIVTSFLSFWGEKSLPTPHQHTYYNNGLMRLFFHPQPYSE